MSKKDEALKLALGKIKSARDCHPNAVNTLLFEAEEILEEALAEDVPETNFGNMAAKQEPVPSIIQMLGHCPECGAKAHHFTSPPAQRTWVGLTDEEIDKTHETKVWDARRSYARAIEAKLKEKNT